MGFVFLCLLPMCAIVAASAAISSNSWCGRQERELSQRLGLAVTIERVVHTQPHGVRYEGLQLTDPETHAPLARVKSLTILQHDQTWYLSAVAPELFAAQLDELQQLVTRQLKLGKPGERVWATTPKLTMHMADKSQLVVDEVNGDFTFNKTEANALVKFRPVDRESEEPIEFWIGRNRQTTPPEIGFQLITGDSALPCQLAAPFVPACAGLGAHSKFRGGLRAVASTKGWNGELKGEFLDVDLAALVNEHFPHQLAGSARLTIENARFAGSRVEQLDGSLFCGGGTIHHELAEQLCREWRLVGENVNDRFGDRHPFSELAFGFALDSRGLLIAGQCKSTNPGAVLVDRYAETIHEPTPAARLPLESIEVMFHRSRAALMGLLPVVEEKPLRR